MVGQSKKNLYLLLLALGLGALLRLYQLGTIPYGYTWDEAAIIYNGWSIAQWHRDEFVTFMPLSFKSFGDYKAPGLIYTLAVLYKVSGLHEIAIRLISSLAGVGQVCLIFYIAKEFFPNKALRYPLFATFALAISPWAIHISRVGFEANVALSLVLLGLYSLLKTDRKWQWLLVSASAFAASMYFYHGPKLFVPLLLISFAATNITKIKKNFRVYLALGILMLLMIVPLINEIVTGNGAERANTLILGSDMSLPEQLSGIGRNIVNNLSPEMWVLGQDAIGLRHGMPFHGALNYTTYILMITGIIACLKKRKPKNIFLILWLLVGLVPSILSIDSPHLLRALPSFIAGILIAAKGLQFIIEQVSNNQKILIQVVCLLLIVETSLYLSNYFNSYAVASAKDFQAGYKQAVLASKEYGRSKDKIIFTDAYGQPYIYTLLYKKISAEQFNFGALANYEFKPIKWDERQDDYLYVGTPEEIPESAPEVIEIITVPNSSEILFVIAQTDEN